LRVFILKPDAVGDFILATGCIRLMARELGEKNLVIAVRADVAPLARAQFPDSEFVGPGAQLYPNSISGQVLELKASSLAKLFATGSAQLVDVSPMYLRKPDAVEPTTRKSVL